jgi:hypothetical protein
MMMNMFDAFWNSGTGSALRSGSVALSESDCPGPYGAPPGAISQCRFVPCCESLWVIAVRSLWLGSQLDLTPTCFVWGDFSDGLQNDRGIGVFQMLSSWDLMIWSCFGLRCASTWPTTQWKVKTSATFYDVRIREYIMIMLWIYEFKRWFKRFRSRSLFREQCDDLFESPEVATWHHVTSRDTCESPRPPSEYSYSYSSPELSSTCRATATSQKRYIPN